MAKLVTFWFDYLSPFAFFSQRRIRPIAAREGFGLDPVPYYHPQTAVAPGVVGIAPAKLSYIVEDMIRGAKKYGLALSPPQDLDLLAKPPKAPSQRPGFLAFQWAKAQGKAWEASDALFEARWLRGARTGEPEVVADVLGAAGFDRAAALRAIRDETHGKELDEIAARAEREGIFGIPTFVYRGQRFWGDDRVDALVEAVRAG
ncbi:MAG TPA: DsbA family protein [Myxococcota bacterium]|nr:DsbA family protein [Myxococcota bacterium]